VEDGEGSAEKKPVSCGGAETLRRENRFFFTTSEPEPPLRVAGWERWRTVKDLLEIAVGAGENRELRTANWEL
jgi:hypothetical protein